MRKLLLVILLVGVFLGGYYAGRQPGSPDIISAVARVCERIAGEVNHAVAATPQPDNRPGDQPDRGEPGSP